MSNRFFIVAACVLLVTVGLSLRHALGKDLVKSPTTMPAPTGSSPLDFTVKDIDGKDVNLADYRGKVVLLVNVASKCGFTPQYKALEALYETYNNPALTPKSKNSAPQNIPSPFH
jgi:hypothetical protein